MVTNIVNTEQILVQTANCPASSSSPPISPAIIALVTATEEANKAINAVKFELSTYLTLLSTGSVTSILVPFPTSLSISILPSWYSTTCFTIASPSPVPPICLE